MSWFANLPVQRKLGYSMLLTSTVALLAAGGVFLVVEYTGYRRSLVHTVSTLARITADNSTAAIAFSDKSGAAQTLEALRAEPQIVAATLFDARNQLFARYHSRPGEALEGRATDEIGLRFEHGYLIAVEPVVEGSRRLGTLYLHATMDQIYVRMRNYALGVANVLALSFVLAWLVASVLRRTLARPILELANTAGAISANQDYSLRARQYGQDELGRLTATFNAMLEKTQAAVGAMRESEWAHRELVRALPTAAYMCDARGLIVIYNEAAVALWGRSPDIGREHWCGSHRMYRADGTLLPPDDCPTAVALKESRAVRDEEIIIERPDGTRRNVLPHPEPIRNTAGAVVGIVTMLVDITEQKRADRAVRQLASIVESSGDAIISKDLNGIIVTWNRGAEQLFGYTAGEIVGRPITVLIPADRQDEEAKILQRIRRGESIEHLETVRRRRDGSLVDISLMISPIRDQSRKVIGASKISRDITERKQVENELKRARDEALAASQAKDEFLAALSHELRTPLNPVLLLASDAASNPELPPGIRADFSLISKNVALEARLIDDLLDLTRITRGKLLLDRRRCDVHAILQDAIANVQAELVEKRLQLVSDFAAKEYLVLGDSVRLQQIFWNVLKNAVKFTPEKGRITVETRQSGTETLTVRITDTGIGMTPEEIGRVFQAFTQGDHAADGSGSHRFGGLGLGLAITNMLVEMHGGQVRAFSEGHERGSAFVIDLPRYHEPAEKADQPPDGHPTRARPNSNSPVSPAAKRRQKLATPSGRRILLVEDHAPTRQTLQQLLRHRGFQVTPAESAAEAHRLALEDEFDLIISDVGLPDRNGHELMSDLRTIHPRAIGIALSGYGMEEDRTRSQAAGFSLHLVKPVTIGMLEEAIARLCHRPGDDRASNPPLES